MRVPPQWLMVLVAFVEVFTVLGLPNTYDILFARLQEEFGAGAALTGWVGSIANTLIYCSPISPLLIRRFGPRTVILLGVLISSGGLLATSFVPGIAYAYLTFGILVGTGGNFVVQSVVFVVYKWFPEKNCSRATSITWLGTSFGKVAFAPLLNSLITAHGWRNSLRIVCAGCFVIGAVHGAFIVLPKKVEDQAQESNTGGDNDHEDESAERTSMVAAVKAIHEEQASETLRQRLRKLLLQPDTLSWLLGFLMQNIGWSFVIINYASFMEYDLRFSTDQISVALVLAAVGEILGKITFSVFGDHLPCLKLCAVAVTCLLAALLSGLMTVLRTVLLVDIISFIVGVVRGVSYVSPSSATMELFGNSGPDIVTALFMIPMGVGLFIGGPLTGGLYDLTGDYSLSLLITAAIFVCAAIAMLIIPLRRRLQSSAGHSNRSASAKSPAEFPVAEMSTKTMPSDDSLSPVNCQFQTFAPIETGIKETSV